MPRPQTERPHGEGLRVILIGGTSHAGKSTLAAALAERLGWRVALTDALARHPGRPWPRAGWAPPPQVAEHYRSLPVEALIASVTAHSRGTVWPLAVGLVESALASSDDAGLVLEGSALLPELVAGAFPVGVAALWLTARDETLRARMHAESRTAERGDEERVLIDAFLAPARRFKALVMDSVTRHGLLRLEVDELAPRDAMPAARALGLPLSPRDAPSDLGSNAAR